MRSRWSSLPELASLELFASVVELGSLSTTAVAHGLSQPSVSERMRQLERQLGLQLLDRSPTGSVPTPAGSLVAEWVAGVLASVDELAIGVAALRGPTEAHLTVAASYTIAEHLLPGWLGAVRSRHPEAGLELDVLNSAEVLERVGSGCAEVGFIESPGRVCGLASKTIGVDELVVVVWPSHRWAGARRRVSVEELASTPLVVREEGSGTREALVVALGGTEVTAFAELGSNAAVRAAVLAEAAPAVLSRLAVESDVVSGRLVAVAIEGVALRRTLRAVWRREGALGALAATLIERAVQPSAAPAGPAPSRHVSGQS